MYFSSLIKLLVVRAPGNLAFPVYTEGKRVAPQVAEMTGRTGALRKDEDGCISFVTRRSEDSKKKEVNLAEKRDFMAGRKLVAIISDAASVGISLQADKR